MTMRLRLRGTPVAIVLMLSHFVENLPVYDPRLNLKVADAPGALVSVGVGLSVIDLTWFYGPRGAWSESSHPAIYSASAPNLRERGLMSGDEAYLLETEGQELWR